MSEASEADSSCAAAAATIYCYGSEGVELPPEPAVSGGGGGGMVFTVVVPPNGACVLERK